MTCLMFLYVTTIQVPELTRTTASDRIKHLKTTDGMANLKLGIILKMEPAFSDILTLPRTAWSPPLPAKPSAAKANLLGQYQLDSG